MRFEPTDLAGVVLLHWEFVHDERGSFARTFCAAEMDAAGVPFRIEQTNLSRNAEAGTLRGMHYQRPPHGEPKIVSCTRGAIWDVAVDMRPHSPTYRKWQGFHLAPDRGCALHLPDGIAHGFITLEPDSEVHYLMGAAYVPGAATGVRWNDPAVGIQWPVEPAVVSERDAAYPLLKRLP